MQKNWANISAGWIYSSNNVNVILSREMFWQPPTWFFPWYKLQQRNKSKSLFFLLAAPCKNILELCVVEVSQPGGMNLEFAVCLVHEESAAGAAGYNRRWCRVQLQVKRTWQTDLELSDCWETQTGGNMRWGVDKRSWEGTHKGHIVQNRPPLNQPLVLYICVYTTLDSRNPDHLSCSDTIPLWNMQKIKNPTFENQSQMLSTQATHAKGFKFLN